jgi:hypothetical protein
VAVVFNQSINFSEPTFKKFSVDPLCSAKIAQCVYEFDYRIWQSIQAGLPFLAATILVLATQALNGPLNEPKFWATKRTPQQ